MTEPFMSAMKKYEEILKTMSEINASNRLDIWRKRLEERTKDNKRIKTCLSDTEILLVKLDLPNQGVVKTDSKRTRPELEDKSTFIGYLELMVTYYCKLYNITYKQGLNELLAPFLHLKKGSSKGSLHTVFNVFVQFCETYAPTLYNDEEFLSLEYSLVVIRILLKYHDPELFFHMQDNGVTPELYSTSWLLTLFAYKHELEMVYQFWDFLIISGVQDFIFYTIVALLIQNRERILEEKLVTLPQLISSLTIATSEDLFSVLGMYYFEFRENTRGYLLYIKTPESFKSKLAKSCVYNAIMDKESSRKDLEKIEEQTVLTVDTNEVLSAVYKDYCENCINSKRHEIKVKANTVINVPQATTINPLPLTGIKTLATNGKFQYKSFMGNGPNKSLQGSKTEYCKFCSREIPKRIVIELGTSHALFDSYHCNIKNGDKGIMKILLHEASQCNIVLVTDKTPATLDILNKLLRQKVKYLAFSTDPIEVIRKKQRILGYNRRDTEISPLTNLISKHKEEEVAKVQLNFYTEDGSGQEGRKISGEQLRKSSSSSLKEKNGCRTSSPTIKITHNKEECDGHCMVEELKVGAYYLDHGIDSPIIITSGFLELLQMKSKVQYLVKRQGGDATNIYILDCILFGGYNNLVAIIAVNMERNMIISRFYWKDLLKIASKIQNPQILIFYFGLSNTIPAKSITAENVAKAPETLDYPHKRKEYRKSTVVYEFDSLDLAKECIVQVKIAYKRFKSSLRRSTVS